MARVIQVEFRAEAGQFEQTAQRIIDRTSQMNRIAQQGAQQSTAAITAFTATLSGVPSVLNQIAGAMGIAFGVGAIVAFGKHVLDVAGKIDDLSKRTGFTRQTLSGIKSAIEENGGSLEGFATAINKLQKSLGDVNGAGKEAAIALNAIGVNVKANCVKNININ